MIMVKLSNCSSVYRYLSTSNELNSTNSFYLPSTYISRSKLPPGTVKLKTKRNSTSGKNHWFLFLQNNFSHTNHYSDSFLQKLFHNICFFHLHFWEVDVFSKEAAYLWLPQTSNNNSSQVKAVYYVTKRFILDLYGRTWALLYLVSILLNLIWYLPSKIQS